jgi:hypothetical protein
MHSTMVWCMQCAQINVSALGATRTEAMIYSLVFLSYRIIIIKVIVTIILLLIITIVLELVMILTKFKSFWDVGSTGLLDSVVSTPSKIRKRAEEQSCKQLLEVQKKQVTLGATCGRRGAEHLRREFAEMCVTEMGA